MGHHTPSLAIATRGSLFQRASTIHPIRPTARLSLFGGLVGVGVLVGFWGFGGLLGGWWWVVARLVGVGGLFGDPYPSTPPP